MSETSLETSPRKLAAACAAAGLGAAAILALFVLPAERGIDPTGVGAALGLTGMVAAPAPPEAVPAVAKPPAAQSKATIAKAGALRSDEQTIVMPPHTGAEIKARMGAGDHMIFRWEASGPVRADMHGEPPNADGEFTSYWKEADLTSGQGAFTAPFQGTHGWYWRNRGETPVTVKVRTSGFYQELFKPPPE